MRKELRELAEQIILEGTELASISAQGITFKNFREEEGTLFVEVLSGIETLANLYKIKNVNIEDAIVRLEDYGICFYQYVAEDKRKEVFYKLLLGNVK